MRSIGPCLSAIVLVVQASLATELDGQSAALPPSARVTRTIKIGTPVKSSNVAGAWRQGAFLQPQSVSAVDVSDDGRYVGVTTMAFRQDRNFWLLANDGKVAWGRYVQPWAPFQAAVLPQGKDFGVGPAYSRVTDPSPTQSLFHSEKSEETALVDSVRPMGRLRYGRGDWCTGRPAGLLGDVIVRTEDSILTVFSNDGAIRLRSDGSRQKYPLLHQRPFRMTAGADGRVRAFGFLVPDVRELDDKTRQKLRLPPALLTLSDAATSEKLWQVNALEVRPVPMPPEPADEFPDMAEDFNMKALTPAPFRVAVSTALNGDSSRVAITEYGGRLRIKRERGIGGWNPYYPVPF